MISIKAENLSKAYQLGEIGTGTISRDLERWYARIRGKEDPFLRIGETNDRTSKGNSDIVWSLKDINFEIEQGDAVGIIGRNGAGKSTLLKVLSRVTSPTTGRITGKGRIASLLEVGTGFHPELTGRENIYLNGAILGMRKKEITRKFDEIVDFAGVERYIDTPVKRYSSGMYVRLAFAVAAHLESEILIVDEVLAVGDAEFQKKCLGKMGEVSKGEGRTVLFVSHNMGSIKALCNNGIYLKNGLLKYAGEVKNTIKTYLGDTASLHENLLLERKDKVGNKKIEVSQIVFRDKDDQVITEVLSGDYLKIEFDFINNANINPNDLIVACSFTDNYENTVAVWVSDEMPFKLSNPNKIILEIPHFNLRTENYILNYQISYRSTQAIDFCDALKNAAVLSVIPNNLFGGGKIRSGSSALLYAEFK